MVKGKRFVCCICGKGFEGFGNNPEGAAWRNLDGTTECPTFREEDRCCDECNRLYVIPGRLYQANMAKKK